MRPFITSNSLLFIKQTKISYCKITKKKTHFELLKNLCFIIFQYYQVLIFSHALDTVLNNQSWQIYDIITVL